MLVLVLAASLTTIVHAGSTQSGDITAAIRAAGLSTSVVVEPSATADGTSPKLVDGLLVDRYLTACGEGPVVFNMSLPDGFVSGEDVVVTGITFCVNTKWGSYAARMPKSWTVEGSNDGAVWKTISTVSGFGEYSASGDVYRGTSSFLNWKSFRAYRITVTEATGSATYFLQISEISLLGMYGGTIVQPDPELIDVTKRVRDAGKQTCRTNAGFADASLDADCAYNGIWGKTDRYLSNSTTTKALFDAGKSVDIDYCIDDAFCSGADIVVTAYTIYSDLTQFTTTTLPRIPKSWQLQGSNDGVNWTTLDTITGFSDWGTKLVEDERDHVDHTHYCYTFKFVNSTSYRQYRLSVSELYDRSKSGDMVQISEIQLFGYLDVEIAGKVGKTMEGMELKITAHEASGKYAPSITISQIDDTTGTHAGKVADLFDGSYNSEMLLRMGTDADELAYAPIVIGYEMNSSFLESKDIVLKSYKLVALSTAGLANRRLPKVWRLEGYIGGTWRRLDSRRDFSDWSIDSDKKVYYAEFNLPNNQYSCRNYRLLVSEVSGLSQLDTRTAMHQLRMSEIELKGEWGTGIAKPWEPKGSFIIVW